MRLSFLLAFVLSTAAGCASSPGCRIPHEPVGAAVYVVGKTLAVVNAQPSACQQPGPRYMRLAGRVDRSGPIGLEPVPFVEVDLVHEGKVVATGATDARGAFRFTELVDSGLYDLRVVSDRYDGQARVLLDGERSEVSVLARPR
jgi:hypothetical protein